MKVHRTDYITPDDLKHLNPMERLLERILEVGKDGLTSDILKLYFDDYANPLYDHVGEKCSNCGDKVTKMTDKTKYVANPACGDFCLLYIVD